jgi:hypothetical protein
LAVADPLVTADRERLRQDYIDRIKRDRIRNERQQLARQIRLAEIQENHEQLDDLKQKFNQLIKR